MAVTGAIFNSLSFGGVNSADYGIYITGEAVFNAPKRAVEMVTVPGRNGDVAIDQGRWENIEVTYPAGTFGMDESEFATAISDFRNAIVSQIGYQRLTDTYHPDEYRMALYADGLEVETTTYNKAGEFELKFNCKPQRWLTSGETPVTIGEWGATKTASGEIVTIESEGGEAAKSLEVSLEPIQSGSGTPSPDNVRPISGRTEVNTIVSPTTTASDGTTYTTALGQTVYGGTLDVVSGVLTVDRVNVTFNGSENWEAINQGLRYYGNFGGKAYSTKDVSNMLTYATSDPTLNPNSYKFTVGGFINVGVPYTVAEWKSLLATTNLQVVYELATPQTYQLTPQQISLLLGENHVWSDGAITMQYGDDPNSLWNPTQYDAGPLLAVKGYGNIGFNGFDIEIDNAVMGAVTLSTTNNTLKYSNSLFNAGDTVSVAPSTVVAFVHLAYATSRFYEINFSKDGSKTSDFEIQGHTILISPSTTAKITLQLPAFNFTAGTTAEKNAYYYATVRRNTDSGMQSETFSFTIRVRNVASATESQIIAVIKDIDPVQTVPVQFRAGTGQLGDVTIDSTVSFLGDPTYIDCEIGEAYKLDGDTVIGLNKYIELGSDLPTLASGANEVTYDNTITELKITPNWWKL